jgi:glycosyltransferase involved in cell wall biosynthesis
LASLTIGYDGKRAALNAVGLGNYSRNLLRDLSTERPENRYVVYSPSPFDPKLSAEFTPHPSITLRAPESRPRFKLLRHLQRHSAVVRQAREDRLSLFHGLTHTLPAGLPCPSVVTVHDLMYLRRPEDFGWFERTNLHRICKAAVRRAARVIAVSEATKIDVVERLGVAPEKVVVTWQSCSPRFRRERVTEDDLARVRAKHALPPRFILQVGTVEPRKNALRLVRAFHRLGPRGEGVQLLIAGLSRSDYAQEVRAAAQASGGTVRLLGHVDTQELPALYTAASLFAYVPLIEGFGIPVLEALSCGTPVVTSNASSLREVGGPAAIPIDPLSEDSIAEGLAAGLDDGPVLARVRAAMPAHVAKFSPAAVVERVMDVYRAAL